jgi:hypothetical protein
MATLIADKFAAWEREAEERFQTLKRNEEELNRIFIDIYGLQDELTPEVEDKDVTVRRADLGREIRSLLSYAVGCMFGRYSLDTDGLKFAGGEFSDQWTVVSGQYYERGVLREYGCTALSRSDRLAEGNDTDKRIGNRVPCKFGYFGGDGAFARDREDAVCAYAETEHCPLTANHFQVVADNVIPITDEDYYSDDVLGRFVDFVRVAYGTETLEVNLDFIAKALGNKGATSREVIRNYFLKDFYPDHCKIYKKRPIYWLFDSGKQDGFKALVYMHRWNADTIGNLRVEHLHKLQRVYESEIKRMQETAESGGSTRDAARANARRDKLTKQLKETKDYDAKIAHLAHARINIDLDDGVKVNYDKVQTGTDGKHLGVLAKI